ncbi:erythromycin esterase family protein [Hymenobacter sp. RP-2-7]|uniref:Erythromycin esterase family protein n=1 Tax=Hymenobacter polaris TaxID=2682546 RepID=A0A7Y0AGH7_9BACT|nr:erythromycin esterase family protein [Hymenobacter polaris]NML66921.1 erythromycin esterase family protein [Hymenobacter polaris]
MLGRLHCFLFLLALGLLPTTAWGQAHLNLALEPATNQHRPLLLWGSYLPPGGRYSLDSTVAHQGRGSLHLHLPPAQGAAARYTTVGTGLLPLDSVRGQLVTVSAWVRTRNWRGRAGLTASATSLTRAGLSPESVSALDSLPANQDWRRLELRFPVKATAFSCYLGLQTQGSGDIWLADVALSVRGRRLPEWPVPATEALLLPPAQVLALNWDFEQPLPALARPDPAAATAALDSASPQHGRRYLRAQRRRGFAEPASAYLGSVQVSPREGGKTLRVAGYWRWTGGTGTGGPAFAARLLRSRLRPSLRWRPDTLARRTPPPPGPAWTRFAFELPIQLTLPGTDAEADTASLGAFSLSVLLPAAGAVDVDNLTFAIDGKPYLPTGPPVPPLPTAAEIAWLRAAAKPLKLNAPAADYQDLAALATLVGPARVVGLGEVTHGSHESFGLTARLARYLLTQKNFDCLALEASPAACAALNGYLRGQPGSPAPLLAALGEGWATAEVLALLRELRAHNQAHPTAPVQLAGVEVRQPAQALTYLSEQLLDADDDFAQSRLRQLRTLLATYPHPAPDDPDLRRQPDQPRDSLLGPVHRLLAELRAGLATRAALGQPRGLQQLEILDHYLRLVEQGATWQRLSFGAAFNYRQACLAENVRYLGQTGSADGGPARVLVWASNGAVAKVLSQEERPMGQWLAATLGAGYVALGTALGQGRFLAGGAGPPTPAPLETAPPGAYEAWLRTGPAAYWLPLGHLALTEASAWLTQAQLLRDIGYAATRNQFMLHSLHREFDAVLFLKDSSPTQALP